MIFIRFRISFTSCRATNDGKTFGMFANGRTIKVFIDGKKIGASTDGKNCGILVGGKWLTFDGKTWGATNDGKTCGTPIGGAKFKELLMVAKVVDPHPHLIAKLARLQLMIIFKEVPKMLNLPL